MAAEIVLVSMPWTSVRAPSIQIGTVKALLDDAGLASRTAHFYVPFLDEVVRRLAVPFRDIDEFEKCGWLLGEWVFAVPPFRRQDEMADERFRIQFTAEFGHRLVDQAFAVRRLVPAFLDKCADELLAFRPAVVGFSTTFAQTIPSVVLAKVLKERQPDIKVVIGGSNCEGPMGAAIHRLFPWIDVVVRGEAENVVGRLFSELVAGSPVAPLPGLCLRDGERSEIVPEQPARTSMATVPLPAYEEYFERVGRSAGPLRDARLWLPYETSRGCWWGVKHLCTFCAANGQTLSFRSKPPDVVVAQIHELTRRYGVRNIWLVDNILDERYPTTVFPALRDRGEKLRLFVETKAHLSKESLRLMRAAGVVMAQVGIESLSTPVLRLMEKGTRAFQNVRILKWCAELGIKPFWNIIYGFPGEPPDSYSEMAELIPSLVHLPPPNPPVPLRLDRFSPYHNDPAAHGMEITGPLPVQRYVHRSDSPEVMDLQYFFSFRYVDDRNPRDYVVPLLTACADWHRAHRHSATLSYEVDDGVVTIHERRPAETRADHVLSPLESRTYLACDAGASPQRIWRELGVDDKGWTTPQDLREWLDVMVDRRLMMRDGTVYLALALRALAAPPRPRPELSALDSLSDARTGFAEVHNA